MNSKIDGKAPQTVTPVVLAKVRQGVPMHKAIAGAVARPTGPRVRV